MTSELCIAASEMLDANMKLIGVTATDYQVDVFFLCILLQLNEVSLLTGKPKMKVMRRKKKNDDILNEKVKKYIEI